MNDTGDIGNTDDPDENGRIEEFLRAGPWAVVGASKNRAKYGNKVLRAYLQHDKRPVFPVNPRADEVEELRAYPTLSALPQEARAISIITPAEITEQVIDEALTAGVRHVWMQPGAESARAIERAEAGGLGVIAGGPCLLVVLGFRE